MCLFNILIVCYKVLMQLCEFRKLLNFGTFQNILTIYIIIWANATLLHDLPLSTLKT